LLFQSRHVEIDLAGWQQVVQPEKVANLLANLRTSSTTRPSCQPRLANKLSN